ncbi:conserved hypothetical protein [Hyella patelloides LEGE 07179]|uniref:DUF4327 domain-containing protein n=1 Tax=Hyella patelloides LEGE 07179 TaxID=945734 RepID=A0A563VKM7_9CYAN|nr:DUF4327 family protein [Hyella patelloides]VEP12010.1 conserved hypothetical protein [Hyella patelloides LEGE 07179]
MSVATISHNHYINYSIDAIKDEARHLIEKGTVSRQQPIYTLCEYIPAREWVCIEYQLERCEYLLRDSIGDLVADETWEND